MLHIKYVAAVLGFALVLVAIPQSTLASGQHRDKGSDRNSQHEYSYRGHDRSDKNDHDKKDHDKKQWDKKDHDKKSKAKWDHHKHDHSYIDQDDERHKNGDHKNKHGRGHYKDKDHDKKRDKSDDCKPSDKPVESQDEDKTPKQPEPKKPEQPESEPAKPRANKGVTKTQEVPTELPDTGAGLLASFMYSMGAGAAIQGFRSRRKA